MSETMRVALEHVNVPPAQTWNYLHINDVAFEVEPASNATQLPAAFAKLETSLGAEASSWIDGTANELQQTSFNNNGTVHELELLIDGEAQSHCIRLEEGAQLKLSLVVQAAQGTVPAAMLRIIAEKGSSLELDAVYACKADYLEGISLELADDASASIRQYLLQGRKSAVGCAVDMAGERSNLKLEVRYLTTQDELLDMNYVVRMHGAQSVCEMNFSGVLLEGAAKTLRDTIDLCHGAKGAEGLENETVVIAGQNVVNKSLPTILCDEDDVAGDHGATIGSISPEQLAYLSDRGLTPEDATELFCRSIADDAYTRCSGAARELVLASARELFGDIYATELSEGDN